MGKLKSWILLILVAFACVYANAVNPGDETRGEYCLGASSEARGEEGSKLDFKKPELRVLDIGNSFTIDATHYLPLLIEGAELDCSDMCLYVAHRASGSFKSWYDVYNDNDNSSYIIYKQAGGLDADITGSAGPRDGEQFRNTLANNEWDLIIIHQVSSYSTDYENWTSHSDKGYLDELLSIIKREQPQAAIGFLLVHSTASFYSGNPQQSTYKRWEKIVKATNWIQDNYDIDLVIPYGTAVESLRNTEYNNDMDLTADGLHMCSGLGDYTANCAYFEAIFAPRYDTTVLGNKARLLGITDENAVDVDDDNAYFAQMCAVEAMKDFKTIAEIEKPEENAITVINYDTPTSDDQNYYDLSGRKIQNPGPGFYIHRGNKVFIKQ